tara:strand:+ start:117 stop:923 length:807 start_codon:yes stop_codon:yes gene_type:complete
MSIAIFGASGRLGEFLVKFLKKKKIKIFSLGKKNNNYVINFGKEDEIKKFLHLNKPDVIINCVGSTNVNKCNKNYNFAKKKNFITAKNISKSLIIFKRKIHLIHISTDQVYNSKNNIENKINLTNNYSKSKYLGEKEILKYKYHTILRTNFYGSLMSKKNLSFSDFILKQLKNKKKIKVPDNIYFNPIELKKLCQIILKIKNKKIYGTYNLGGKRITKFNFAKKIAAKYNLNKNLIIPYKSKLKKHLRPLNTSMNCIKLEKKLNLKLN